MISALLYFAGGTLFLAGAVLFLVNSIHRLRNERMARDAARYRYLRRAWYLVVEKHRLEWPRVEWYLPRSRRPIEEQLDESIDVARGDKLRG